MGKVITVWGSPGSGKSMFSCILAKALTRDKRKAIIINAEISVPMLPVWLPEQIIQTNASVGQVLSSVEIDTSLVAGHVTVLKSYPFIGVMMRACSGLASTVMVADCCGSSSSVGSLVLSTLIPSESVTERTLTKRSSGTSSAVSRK